jgi:hypothetical protein
MYPIRQPDKGETTRANSLGEDQLVIHHRRIQPLSQVVLQQLIIGIGEIKLKQGS